MAYLAFLNKYFILTVKSPQLVSQNFMSPLILNTNLVKQESKTDYTKDILWDSLDWEPKIITLYNRTVIVHYVQPVIRNLGVCTAIFFLYGVQGIWCKFDFELYGIHANKIAFCNTFAHVPSK